MVPAGLGYWTHEPDGSLPLAQLDRPFHGQSHEGRPLYIHGNKTGFICVLAVLVLHIVDGGLPGSHGEDARRIRMSELQQS